MGKSESKLPPLSDKDIRTLLAFNMKEEHFRKMWRKFREMDMDYSNVWTAQEMYRVVQEPRLSMRAPIIDALFFMGDGDGEGAIGFPDFLVMFSSFCSLSREEMLQLLFIILDRDRNGRVEKQELLDFFSYVPIGSGGERAPVFPVNDKNALDKFRQGQWTSLAFDGLAQLCNLFPYISYPAYHTQELYRQQFLGLRFWEKFDKVRAMNVTVNRARFVKVPGSSERVEVKFPGRCTMQELLEYSRRKTAVHGGKRVVSQHCSDEGKSSFITKERDEQIARCPILTMIRNPRCMYYVPVQVTHEQVRRYTATRPEFELPDFGPDPESSGRSPGQPAGVIVVDHAALNRQQAQGASGAGGGGEEEEESTSEEDSDDSDEGSSLDPKATGFSSLNLGEGAVSPPALPGIAGWENSGIT